MKSAIRIDPQKILIIKPSAWGDIVHTLPFLAAISKRYPKAEIHWVVARGLHTFMEGHPLIHKIWVMDKDNWRDWRRCVPIAKEINAFRKGLKEERFDISIDLSGLLRSGLITWAAGAEYKLGFSDADEGSPFFYNHTVKGGKQIHAIDRYLKLAKMLDCDISTVSFPFPESPDISHLTDSLADEFCIMAPSAGKEANRWPAERFGQLAAKLPVQSLVIAGPGDAHIAEQVVLASKGKAINMAGRTTLRELLPLIARCCYFICNDTGPMHIAAGLNIPVFALFGPANPVRTGPYGDNHTILQESLSCSPCYAKKPCSTNNWRCMTDLTVEKVFSIINASEAYCRRRPV